MKPTNVTKKNVKPPHLNLKRLTQAAHVNSSDIGGINENIDRRATLVDMLEEGDESNSIKKYETFILKQDVNYIQSLTKVDADIPAPVNLLEPSKMMLEKQQKLVFPVVKPSRTARPQPLTGSSSDLQSSNYFAFDTTRMQTLPDVTPRRMSARTLKKGDMTERPYHIPMNFRKFQPIFPTSGKKSQTTLDATTMRKTSGKKTLAEQLGWEPALRVSGDNGVVSQFDQSVGDEFGYSDMPRRMMTSDDEKSVGRRSYSILQREQGKFGDVRRSMEKRKTFDFKQVRNGNFVKEIVGKNGVGRPASTHEKENSKLVIRRIATRGGTRDHVVREVRGGETGRSVEDGDVDGEDVEYEGYGAVETHSTRGSVKKTPRRVEGDAREKLRMIADRHGVLGYRNTDEFKDKWKVESESFASSMHTPRVIEWKVGKSMRARVKNGMRKEGDGQVNGDGEESWRGGKVAVRDLRAWRLDDVEKPVEVMRKGERGGRVGATGGFAKKVGKKRVLGERRGVVVKGAIAGDDGKTGKNVGGKRGELENGQLDEPLHEVNSNEEFSQVVESADDAIDGDADGDVEVGHYSENDTSQYAERRQIAAERHAKRTLSAKGSEKERSHESVNSREDGNAYDNDDDNDNEHDDDEEEHQREHEHEAFAEDEGHADDGEEGGVAVMSQEAVVEVGTKKRAVARTLKSVGVKPAQKKWAKTAHEMVEGKQIDGKGDDVARDGMENNANQRVAGVATTREDKRQHAIADGGQNELHESGKSTDKLKSMKTRGMAASFNTRRGRRAAELVRQNASKETTAESKAAVDQMIKEVKIVNKLVALKVAAAPFAMFAMPNTVNEPVVYEKPLLPVKGNEGFDFAIGGNLTSARHLQDDGESSIDVEEVMMDRDLSDMPEDGEGDGGTMQEQLVQFYEKHKNRDSIIGNLFRRGNRAMALDGVDLNDDDTTKGAGGAEDGEKIVERDGGNEVKTGESVQTPGGDDSVKTKSFALSPSQRQPTEKTLGEEGKMKSSMRSTMMWNINVLPPEGTPENAKNQMVHFSFWERNVRSIDGAGRIAEVDETGGDFGADDGLVPLEKTNSGKLTQHLEEYARRRVVDELCYKETYLVDERKVHEIIAKKHRETLEEMMHNWQGLIRVMNLNGGTMEDYAKLLKQKDRLDAKYGFTRTRRDFDDDVAINAGGLMMLSDTATQYRLGMDDVLKEELCWNDQGKERYDDDEEEVDENMLKIGEERLESTRIIEKMPSAYVCNNLLTRLDKTRLDELIGLGEMETAKVKQSAPGVLTTEVILANIHKTSKKFEMIYKKNPDANGYFRTMLGLYEGLLKGTFDFTMDIDKQVEERKGSEDVILETKPVTQTGGESAANRMGSLTKLSSLDTDSQRQPTKTEEAKSTPKSMLSSTCAPTIANNLRGTHNAQGFYSEAGGNPAGNKEIGSVGKGSTGVPTSNELIMPTRDEEIKARRASKLSSDTLIPMPEIIENETGHQSESGPPSKELLMVQAHTGPLAQRQRTEQGGVPHSSTAASRQEQASSSGVVKQTLTVGMFPRDSILMRKNMFPSLSALGVDEGRVQSLISRAGTNTAMDVFQDKSKEETPRNVGDGEVTSGHRKASGSEKQSRQTTRMHLTLPDRRISFSKAEVKSPRKVENESLDMSKTAREKTAEKNETMAKSPRGEYGITQVGMTSTKQSMLAMNRNAMRVRNNMTYMTRKTLMDPVDQLFLAIIKDNFADLQDLLYTYPNIFIDSRDAEGNTPLIIAAKTANVDIVNILLAKGAHINMQNKNGDTALHMALYYHSNAVADVLIQKGGAQSIRNNQSKTPWEMNL